MAFDKQLGRLEKLDLDSDELFTIAGDPIPNDPGLPRVKIGPRFDKQTERFKDELDDDIKGGEELLLEPRVLTPEKVLFKMDKM